MFAGSRILLPDLGTALQYAIYKITVFLRHNNLLRFLACCFLFFDVTMVMVEMFNSFLWSVLLKKRVEIGLSPTLTYTQHLMGGR